MLYECSGEFSNPNVVALPKIRKQEMQAYLFREINSESQLVYHCITGAI